MRHPPAELRPAVSWRWKVDELVDTIVQKTGLSRDKAEDAAKTTINWLKDRLPSSVAGQIDSVLVTSKVSEVAGKVERAIGR